MHEYIKTDLENRLKQIAYGMEISNEEKIEILKQFLYIFLQYLDFDLWSYIVCNFQYMDTSTVREFKDQLEKFKLLSFINEWAILDFIDNDWDFMREFRKEFKWDGDSFKER